MSRHMYYDDNAHQFSPLMRSLRKSVSPTLTVSGR